MPVINIGIDISGLQRGAATASATLNGISVSAAQAQKSTDALASSISSAAKQVLALVGAYKALETAKGFAERGIEFNSAMEQSQIGIAAVITSMAKLEDSQGNVLKGAEKYAAAQGLASDMMKEIQRLGLETTATTKDLVQGVQNVMGSALNVGMKLEDIPKFAVSAAQAMQTLGIPLEQMRTEVDAILTGQIDSGDDILAKRLNLNKEMIQTWQQQGKLVEELTKKLEPFNLAGKDVANTWKGLTSNLQDAIDIISGQAAAGLSNTLKDSARNLQSLFITSKDGTTGISQDFANVAAVIERVQSAIGEGILSAVNNFASGIRSLNTAIGEMGGADAAIGEVKTAVLSVSAALASLALVKRSNTAATQLDTAANAENAVSQTRFSAAVVQLTEAERQAAQRLKESLSTKVQHAKAALENAQASLTEAKATQQSAAAAYRQAQADKEAANQKLRRRTAELEAAQAATAAATAELRRAEADVMRARTQEQVFQAEQRRIAAINNLNAAQERAAVAEQRVNAIRANSANINRQLNAAEAARVAALGRLTQANNAVAASQAAVNVAQGNLATVTASTRNIGLLAASVTRLGTAFKSLWAFLGGGVGIAIMGVVSGLTYLRSRQDDAAKAADLHTKALETYKKATEGASDETGKLTGKLSALQRQRLEVSKAEGEKAYRMQLKETADELESLIASQRQRAETLSEYGINIRAGNVVPQELLDSLSDLIGQLEQGKINANDFQEKLAALRQAAVVAGHGNSEFVKTLDELNKEKGVVSLLVEYAKTLDLISGKSKEASSAVREVSKAGKEQEDAIKAINEANKSEIRSAEDAVKWLTKRTAQTESMTAVTEENNRATDEAALKKLQLAEAMAHLDVSTAVANAAMAENTEEANKAVDAAVARLQKIQQSRAQFEKGLSDLYAGRTKKKSSGDGGASQIESARQSIARLREEIDQLNGTASKEGGALQKKLADIEKMGKTAKMSAAEIQALKNEYSAAFKVDTLRDFDKTLLQIEGDAQKLREAEIAETMKEWGLRFADLGMTAEEAAPKLERLKTALETQESYKDLQTAADFYKELADMSGEYGQSIEYQNQLIDRQAQAWIQADIPVADVQRRTELMRQELSRDMFDGMVRGARKFGAEYGDMAAQVESFTQQMGNTIANTLADSFMKGKFSAYDFFNSLISYAAQAVSNAAVGKIIGGIGSAFGGLFSGGADTSAAGEALVRSDYYHSGGIAGKASGRSGLFPASVFSGAPRFHSGGGFGADEYPAVLLRGERVLNRDETRAYNAGQASVGMPSVNVSTMPPNVSVNIINNTGQQVQAQTETRQAVNGGLNLDVILQQVDKGMVGLAKSGKSQLANYMQKAYGLNRAGTLMQGRGRA